MDGTTLGLPEEHCPEHPSSLAFSQSCMLLPGVTKVILLLLGVFVATSNEFNLAVSIHSRPVHTCKHAADSPSAQADMAQPHRDAPTLSIHCTLANAKQPVAKCPRKEPCCGCIFSPLFLLLVCKNLSCKCNNFPICIFSPSNVDMRKLTKDQNSGGDLTTKGPIYGVQ